MSGRTDTVKEARVRFWRVTAFAALLLAIGANDIGLEAIPWGVVFFFAGWNMGEACNQIGQAMDAEERG